MSIQYTGPGAALGTTPAAVYQCPTTVKAGNIAAGMIANNDAVFHRTILVSGMITGRNLAVFTEVEVPYGSSLPLPVMTLNPGEELRMWANISGVANVTLSVGEQK